MKKLILLIFILLITNSGYSLDTLSSKFFPIRTGNKWFYLVTHFQEPQPTYEVKILKILNDTLINSKRYYKMIGFPFTDDTGKMFVRYDSTNGILMEYIPESFCNNEFRLFKLSSVFGDTTGPCSASLQYTCNQIKDTVLFNQNTTIKNFGFYIQGGHSGSIHDYTFAKNIGLYFVQNTSYGNAGIYGASGDLRGYIINGVVYGDTASVLGIHSISNEIPSHFQLYQNYPNPFNPTTKIRFALPPSTRGSFAKLVIYDILGRELETLVNEQLNEGTYEADWSAGKFSSGVYYYKLVAEDFSDTKKMVLVR